MTLDVLGAKMIHVVVHWDTLIASFARDCRYGTLKCIICRVFRGMIVQWPSDQTRVRRSFKNFDAVISAWRQWLSLSTWRSRETHTVMVSARIGMRRFGEHCASSKSVEGFDDA